MGLLGSLVRGYALNRILRGGSRRRSRRYGHRYGYGYGRPRARRRGRGGFAGPFPYYTRRTRGGSRVTVSGCCLPLPLALVTATGVLARALRPR